MGVSNLEARLLSGEARAEKIPEFLRLETERRRSQLHLPPVGKRDDRPELDRRNPRAFSLHHQGAPGAYPHQAPQERGGIPATLPRHPRSSGARRTPGPAALPTPTQLQSRSASALRISE